MKGPPVMKGLIQGIQDETGSFDFASTFVCASTRRCRAAKAETMWIGALDVAFPPVRRRVLP